jgi:hypothetical protein
MRIALALVGVLILIMVVVDLLWTTFLEGAGPLSRHLASRIGKVVLGCHRSRGRKRGVLASIGLLSVCATLLMWGLLTWLAWALIFNGSRTAVVAADTAQPAGFWARVYFAGNIITTLGVGDYRPQGSFWQVMVCLAGGGGFFVFGLAIAYIVPVISAATQKRQLGLCIWALGRSPSDIIIRAWNGVDTTALGPHLVSLTALLALLGESHVTYPVLHFFHSRRRSSAVSPCVAALDEALTILECGLQRGCSLDLPALGAARESITEFLNTLAPALIEPAKNDPPLPSLKELRDMGVPVVEDAVFKQALAGLASRRRLLLALVHNEGWEWDAVWPESEPKASAPGLVVGATA